MNAIVLSGNAETTVRGAVLEGDGFWLSPGDLARATGWEWKPEGLCRGTACVPVPQGAAAGEWARGSGNDLRVNLTRLAGHLGLPLVASPEHGVWAVGETAEDVGERLQLLEAPDFTLPDLEGRRHSLSGFRGRKVFLLAWASW